MEILYSDLPITKKDLDELCKFLQIEILPLQYSNFLLKHNGGQPNPNYFCSKVDKDWEISVNDLYGIGKDDPTGSDIYTIYFAENLEGIPKELLPIGRNGGSDQICLGIKGEYFGKVYIWIKDGQCDEDEEPTFDNVDLIANSFDEFLDCLQEDPDD